jgi:uncharacterized damage-inducible protein DinB
MKIHEFFVERWEAEQRAFGKVLRAIPEGKLDYRPHDRSTAAGDLAWQLVQEQQELGDLLEKGEIHHEHTEHPGSAASIADAYDSATSELRTRLEKLDKKTCARKAKFFVGGKEVWSDTVGNMLWGFLFDMIHHRGQLSAYLRPMGGKVPSIYGPSADDAGA